MTAAAMPARPNWARQVAAMAVVSGVGVAVVYLTQPIQTLVALEFSVPIENSAAPNVAILAGYSLGILLLMPLGDRFPARRQAPIHVLVTGVAIAAAAAAPTHLAFVAISFVIGAATTVGQLLISAALRSSPPATRARTAAVMSGSFIIGLFTTRATIGILADLMGWRAVLVACAIVVLLCVPLAIVAAPRDVASPATSYWRLLRSMPTMVRISSVLRTMTVIQSLGFGAFIALWSTVTVLAINDLGLSVSEASLLAVSGLLGGVTTVSLAPLHARVGERRAMGGALAPLLIGSVVVVIGWHSIPALAVGLYLASVGLSSLQVSTQAIALASGGVGATGRANTIFMTSAFLSGAVVTGIAGQLYNATGYVAVGAISTGLTVLAIVGWGVAMRRGIV